MMRTVFALFVLSVGLMLLFRECGAHSFDWFFNQEWSRYLTPGLLIMIGCWLFKHRNHRRYANGDCGCDKDCKEEAELNDVIDDNAYVNASVMMSRNLYRMDGERFAGGRVSALMGQAKLDLRQAELLPGSTLIISVMMGNVMLFVPQGVHLDIRTSASMCQIDNRTVQSTSDTPVTLHLRVNCMMGKVVLRN